ncbi:MAG: histidine phosphatase family protein [Leptolyngbyaceae cyanobacterium bins.59]|nr:histidine phosphatase family protein [Leptolyngbyaceae cyanobacterium bins.59]
MSLRLYLMRHGETTFSQTGGYCGDLDVDLTAAGMEMAQAFADAYQTVSWEAIYVSPRKRTIATAKPLCDALGMEMQIRDGLREISYGEWEGKTPEELRQNYNDIYLRWMTEPAWNAPPGGETAVQIASRAMPVITAIEQTHPTGNVLIVSHKATIRIIICSLLGIDLGRYRDRITALAASVSIVKYGEYGPLLEVLGDRYHLPEHLRSLPGT